MLLYRGCFYDNITTKTIKVFRVLSCVLYNVIESYLCVDYIWFISKKLSITCSDKIFYDRSYNEFLGIGIT